MKQKDIIVIIAIAFVAGVFSLLITNIVFSNEKITLTAEKVDPISAQFNDADKSVFNDTAINPTQLIKIGDGTNTAKPF